MPGFLFSSIASAGCHWCQLADCHYIFSGFQLFAFAAFARFRYFASLLASLFSWLAAIIFEPVILQADSCFLSSFLHLVAIVSLFSITLSQIRHCFQIPLLTHWYNTGCCHDTAFSDYYITYAIDWLTYWLTPRRWYADYYATPATPYCIALKAQPASLTRPASHWEWPLASQTPATASQPPAAFMQLQAKISWLFPTADLVILEPEPLQRKTQISVMRWCRRRYVTERPNTTQMRMDHALLHFTMFPQLCSYHVPALLHA